MAPSILVQGGTKTGKKTKKPSSDNGSNKGGGSGFSSENHEDAYVVYNEDQYWALCDKDCGWCGHCADSTGIGY
jgi:hypothetical protein